MFYGDFGFGGMPGMHHARSREVDNEKFYKILEVDKNASESEIKKAYRKLAIKHHPDKGGNQEKFKEISRAYEVLSNPEQRRIYDEHGEEGLDGSHMSTDATDIFDLFFGGGSRKPRGKKRGEDVVSNLNVTLEQIYNGGMRKLAVNKDIVCEACDGVGGPRDAFESCTPCGGRGVRIHVRQMGAMIQQTQAMCNVCNGQGKYIENSKRCKSCNGKCVKPTKKILEVLIERGVPDQHRVTFHGEADERPNELPGNLIVVICQTPHELFKRSGTDLVVVKQINLYEALTGCIVHLKHLDGRIIRIKTPENQVIRPGSAFCVENEGMPIYHSAFGKGNLYITFEVEFPLGRTFTSSEKKKLWELFPHDNEKGAYESKDIEENVAHEVDMEELHARARANCNAHQEQEEDDNRVQCKQH